jgi:outer membrane protein insertion porin family
MALRSHGRRCLPLTVLLVAVTPTVATGQARDETTVLDSIAVIGTSRVHPTTVANRAGIPIGQPVSYRDVQRAIEALYAMGQFDSVNAYQASIDGKEVLLFRVYERPILARWTVRGTDRVSDRAVRGRVRMIVGRPYNPADAAAAAARIDSLYRKEGYFQPTVEYQATRIDDASVSLVFDINEGGRATISRIIIEGNEHFSDNDVVGAMDTGPEGFFWFQRGDYDEDKVERDLRERLPAFYAERGHIDFQVVSDTLIIDEERGKATLVITVDEGDEYKVGSFEILGNRQFSNEQLVQMYPFAGEDGGGLPGTGAEIAEDVVFNQQQWGDATGTVSNLYFNNGYIYASVRPVMARRTEADGQKKVDLRWQITEGSPAIVNQIRIVGNTITHESVVRRSILMIPGDVFRQDALLQSYQRISNLGFFEQPLPVPRTERVNQQGDVDIIFEVVERRTGNVNFGASVGQGTGVGGFIGLDEPNLFGKAKRVSFQWQFGSNISDFNITYSDPALRGSLVSGTINLHRTRQRFTVADLGQIKTRGGSLQFGFPLFGSRFTRLLTSYTLQQSEFNSSTLSPRFSCRNCVLSSIGVSIVRDTRVGMPFPTGGALHQFQLAQSGGPLGGSGNFRRATFEGRWYAPLTGADLDPMASPIRLLAGFTAKTGFVWGDAGPHFQQLFSMGGTQFGIPLRGYDEFSITPEGFDPAAQGFRATAVDAFGSAYMALTGEIGVRISQAIYVNAFMDAGNVWARADQFNPSRLFRGAGIGANLISPLGPIGLDYAYGFDRVDQFGNPDPKWKFHFKLGNIF